MEEEIDAILAQYGNLKFGDLQNWTGEPHLSGVSTLYLVAMRVIPF